MSVTIHTLTGNLLWEKTLEFESWAPGKTQRARAESFQVGGKGVNVVRMLARLNVPAKALIFTGGATGEDCERWLTAHGIKYQALETAGATRTGLVVHAPGVAETTFLGTDTPPDATALQACAAHVQMLPTGDVLALCGSFPGWNSADFEPLLAALSTRLTAGGALVAATYGPPLAWLVRQSVD